MHNLILAATLWVAAYSTPTAEYINPTYHPQPELTLCRDCVVAGQINKRVKT